MDIGEGLKQNHICCCIFSMILHSAIQHGNHSPFGVVVSMLGASRSIMENMQQPCGFALMYHCLIVILVRIRITSILKGGVKLLIQPQTSSVGPLKFGNG